LLAFEAGKDCGEKPQVMGRQLHAVYDPPNPGTEPISKPCLNRKYD
jgi:hypothetical protein